MSHWALPILALTVLGCLDPAHKYQDPDKYPVPDDDPVTDADDADGDGVRTSDDCDDNDDAIGELLYSSDFEADDGYLANSPNLTDPWFLEAGWTGNIEGGQQAVLGEDESWTDTVSFVTLSADGASTGCRECTPTRRFRAGILARASEDGDQDEGFHGYRCAVAANDYGECFAQGDFVQIGAFLNEDEDGIASECEDGQCDNPTFDQLDREDRIGASDVLGGDQADLAFWVVGDELVCEFTGADGEAVTARAKDDRFGNGGTGLSVLNAFGLYDHVRVCEAFSVPAAEIQNL